MDNKFENKDELYEYLDHSDLVGLDSEFSFSSKLLVEKFNAKGIDMNRWWVMTSIDWCCPSCNRTKEQILRLNKHGYLIAHLHNHHDHMEDLVEDHFTKLSEAKDHVLADKLSHKFITRIAFSFSAYDKTIICFDCNAADATAKKLAKTPKEFSFSPSEISQFIVVKVNTEHEVDETLACRAWSNCKEAFDMRIKLVNQVAELAANNSHWYQPSETTALQVERQAKYKFSAYGLNKINYIPEDLLYKTNKFKGSNDSWRRKTNNQSSIGPSKGELQHLANVNGTYWKKVDDVWSCPVCRRSKVDCVRRSNQGIWSFTLSTAKLFSDGRFSVCNDCNTTATHLGKEVFGNRGELKVQASSIISTLELRQAIRAKPFNKHSINNDYVDELLLYK